MANSGFFGHGSSSTLSPLAPPFTVDRSVPKFSPNSQSTGPIGDMAHFFNTPIADNWLHIHPRAVSDTDLTHRVENNYPKSGPHDTLLPSLSPNHAFSYSRDSVPPTSLPVAEAEPYYPEYPLPMDGSFEVGHSPSLFSFGPSLEQAGPWSGNSEGGKGKSSGGYASSWKGFKGKVPSFGSGVMQGVSSPSKENLSGWHGKAVEPLGRKDSVGLNGISTEYRDASSLQPTLKENSGVFPYSFSGSCGLQTAHVSQETPSSHLSASLVSLMEWSPFKPISASHVTSYPHLDLHTMEPSFSKSLNSCSSQFPFQPATYDSKSYEKGTPSLEITMQTCDAVLSSTRGGGPPSNKIHCDVQKPRSQILNIKREEVWEEKSGEKDMMFGCSDRLSNEYSKSETMHLNQLNTFTFSSGTGIPVRSSSEVSDQLNHAVDSPCWKGAPSSRSPFAVAVQVPKDEVVGLEVGSSKLFGSMANQENAEIEITCSTPLRNPFSVVCFTSQQKLIVNDEAEANGSEKTEDGSKINTDISVQPIGKIGDPKTCHALPVNVNTSSDLETACSISILKRNAGCTGDTGCSEISEPSEIGNRLPLNLEAKSLVETICNLSKLLLSSQYFDSSTLKDLDYKNLQHVINNLSAYVSAREMNVQFDRTHDRKKPVDSQVDMRSNYEVTQRNLNTNPNQLHNPAGTCDIHCFSSNISKLDGFSSEDTETDCKTSTGTTQPFKQSLRENVFGMEDEHPQAIVYKNLWIEAEAALCSMKYKLQCFQMHVEMEKGSHHLPKDSEDHAAMDRPVIVKEAPTLKLLNCSGRPNPNGERRITEDISSDSGLVRNLSITDETSQTDMDPEAAVMSRLRILKSRHEGSTSTSKLQAQNDPVSDNLGPDKSGIQSLYMKLLDGDIQDGPKQLSNLGFGEDRNPWPYIGERIKNVNMEFNEMGEPIYLMQTLGSNSFDLLPSRESTRINYRGTGDAYYPSSDWEHVLKEELTPKK